MDGPLGVRIERTVRQELSWDQQGPHTALRWVREQWAGSRAEGGRPMGTLQSSAGTAPGPHGFLSHLCFPCAGLAGALFLVVCSTEIIADLELGKWGRLFSRLES